MTDLEHDEASFQLAAAEVAREKAENELDAWKSRAEAAEAALARAVKQDTGESFDSSTVHICPDCVRTVGILRQKVDASERAAAAMREALSDIAGPLEPPEITPELRQRIVNSLAPDAGKDFVRKVAVKAAIVRGIDLARLAERDADLRSVKSWLLKDIGDLNPDSSGDFVRKRDVEPLRDALLAVYKVCTSSESSHADYSDAEHKIEAAMDAIKTLGLEDGQ